MQKQLDIIEHGTAKEVERRRVSLLRAVQPLVTRSQKDILWLFHGFTKRSNVVKGDYVWLGKQIGASRSTTYRAISGLIDAELVTAWNTREGLLQTSNEYVLNWEAIAEAVTNGELRQSVQHELAFSTIEQEVGTDLAPSVNLTLSRVSKRNSGECQNETQPSVKMKLSTISNTLKNYSPSPTQPPIEKKQPTIVDADWEVVVVALQVFGILSERKIRDTINAAKAKGTTPQTVMGLIRFAAGKVIELDAAGKPIAQWRMPADDVLDVCDTSRLTRLYFWKPSIVLWRIAEQGERNFHGVAEGWFCPKDEAAAYSAAQVTLAEVERRSKPPVSAADMVDPAFAAERERLAKRREQLEAECGERLDAMSFESLVELVREACPATWQMLLGSQANQDPRRHRLNRYAALKAFAERFGLRQEAEAKEVVV
jgi:hypothetical protein